MLKGNCVETVATAAPAPMPERFRNVRRSMVFARTPERLCARRPCAGTTLPFDFLVSSIARSSDFRRAVVVGDVRGFLVAARRALGVARRRGDLGGLLRAHTPR